MKLVVARHVLPLLSLLYCLGLHVIGHVLVVPVCLELPLHAHLRPDQVQEPVCRQVQEPVPKHHVQLATLSHHSQGAEEVEVEKDEEKEE